MKFADHLSEKAYASLAIRVKKPKGLTMPLSRQAWLCWWCGTPMTLDGSPAARPTREHLIPQAMCAAGTVNTIVAACYSCNHARGCSLNGPLDHAKQRYVMYLRTNGLWADYPHSRYRHAEMPNFGRDPDGDRLWAPQYGIISGPARIKSAAKMAMKELNRSVA